MQKTAQKRSVLNRLKEMTNVSGLAAEKFFNPEFQRVMENLRETDNKIRAVASGQEIEGASPGEDAASLKDLLKSAKSNLNRREYMSTVAELGRFHKKMFDITQEIAKLNTDVDAVHHEFLFKDLGEEHKESLQALKRRFATQRQEMLTKEANIMDFFYNIGTQRGRALALWEKRYPKQIGKLKKDTVNLLSRSESLLSQTLSALKEMASARATRNVDSYMKAADKIVKSYQAYDKLFREYYLSNVKGFLEKVELTSPTEKVEDKEIGKQEVSVTPQETPAKPKLELPLQSTPPINFPLPPKMPANVGEETIPDTIPAPPPPPEYLRGYKEGLLGKSSHQQFMLALETLSQEDPTLISSYIKRYAHSIQHKQPETAIQLLKLAITVEG